MCCCITAWGAWAAWRDCGGSYAAEWALSAKRWRRRRGAAGRRSAVMPKSLRIICKGGRTGGKAHGVVLATGEEIRARVVVSNADPKRTFLQLAGESELDEDFLRSIRAYRCEGTSLKINLALDALPEFKQAPGAGPHHGATIHICPSIAYMERAWDDAKYGRPSRQPIIEMTIPTVYDPSLAPPGKHVMGIFPSIRPLHPERRKLGRHPRILCRPCHRLHRGICAEHPLHHLASPGSHTSRYRTHIRDDRRQYLPRLDESGSTIRGAARAGLGTLPHADSQLVFVRLGSASRRRRHGGGRLERGKGNP